MDSNASVLSFLHLDMKLENKYLLWERMQLARVCVYNKYIMESGMSIRECVFWAQNNQTPIQGYP